jgi:hypothetical protein
LSSPAGEHSAQQKLPFNTNIEHFCPKRDDDGKRSYEERNGLYEGVTDVVLRSDSALEQCLRDSNWGCPGDHHDASACTGSNQYPQRAYAERKC